VPDGTPPTRTRSAADAPDSKTNVPSASGKTPIKGSGGPGKVYEIPGEELTTGQPYIGKTKQKTVADRMKDPDHKAKTPTGVAPNATTLAEDLTLDEMAGVEALIIDERGLENLSNKIPGLNMNKLKNQTRIEAGKRVLERKE
jgi:hypothetical protein